MLGIFKMFNRRAMFERAAERFACQMPARLELCESGVVFDGRIINMSLGGAMFRPALAYLLSRSEGEVRLSIGGNEIAGEIMGTSPNGYGLRFDVALSRPQLNELLTYSIEEPRAAA
jgi:hypothetical protein